MKIGIYGGSFNPPHLGHQNAAVEAAEKCALDKLLLIPAGISPHKVMEQGSPANEHRLAMTRLMGGQAALQSGIEVEVLGIYVSNDVVYIHTCMYNDTNISFEVDSRRFIVADRKLTKRTAQQQTPLEILRVCNDPAVVRGHQRQRTVFALPKLTISDDKVLLLEIIEKNGARHQTVEIPAEELLEAKLL